MKRDENQGEGNPKADQRYRKGVRKTVSKTSEEERAERARSLSGEEREKAERAASKARDKAKYPDR